MKVSVNWIKEYLDFELPPVSELVQKIGAQLGGVEEVIDLGARYVGIPIVKVIVCEPLENSDHLHRCLVDDGGVVKDMERNEDGLVQVLTGAPNVHTGMLAVWLPPGVTVPESFEKDPFVLTSRPMRGAMSHGMLASAKELGIGDSHEGLLDLSDQASPGSVSIEPGADFAKVFGLDDYIIDIENKMFTHRPDLFGQLGVAREVAGILGKKFTTPQRLAVLDEPETGSGLDLVVENEIPEKVSRFMAVALKDVTVKPSPVWLQVLLARVGAKPISNVVDITNYFMLLTGQPLHAYDYDKVASGKLGVRFAKVGEKLALLNGKTIELNEADMVITNGVKPIGLAGVMGGRETEVSVETKSIILEVATFDMYAIRRTSMRHGLFTDAVTRFNKGQSPLQNPYVMQMVIGHVYLLSGGERASAVIDNDHTEGRTSLHVPVPVTAEFINTRLGFRLSADAMKQLLENVEFQVAVEADNLTVTAPFWRTDVETREDVVEEIGRLYGFDKLPLELPGRSIKPATKNTMLEFKAKIRAELAKAGANEVLNYSFVHGDLLRKSGQNPDDAFQVSNALSPDLQYYRLSLTPSLLANIHPNIKAGYDEFALFELGKGHVLGHMDDKGLPQEFDRITLVYASRKKSGSAYYQAKQYLGNLLAELSLVEDVTFEPLADDDADTAATYYEPGRAAIIKINNQVIGRVGEYKPAVRKALKLPAYTAGFELGLAPLLELQKGMDYISLPRFPKVTQDVTLKVATELPYIQLYDFIRLQLDEVKPKRTVATFEPLDIYQREDDQDYKQLTFRLTIASYEKTMTDAEVSTLLGLIANGAKAKFGAEQV